MTEPLDVGFNDVLTALFVLTLLAAAAARRIRRWRSGGRP
jgi:MYXO-CTERM domain-containing protein